MVKLVFRYGTMNSSKTANLLMVAHNYLAQNKEICLIKPACDTRDGPKSIKSRAFKEGMNCDLIMDPQMTAIDEYITNYNNLQCILVDECQFLSEKNIDALRAVKFDIPIICYGLRTDYRGNLFSGSRRLFEVCDSIEEIKTICVKCNNKAIINSKFRINEEGCRTIIYEGDQIDLGGEEKYEPLCWKCWKNN